jgi:hypothetical protein
VKFSIELETKAFSRFITEFTRKSNVEIDKVLRKIALDLTRRIIEKNPVATGRSRAGWYPAARRLGFDPLKKGSQTAIAEGEAKGDYHEQLGWLARKKFIEIINGVGYVIYLEYGKSKQAPYGMVRVSMREMTGKLPKEITKTYKMIWDKIGRKMRIRAVPGFYGVKPSMPEGWQEV